MKNAIPVIEAGGTHREVGLQIGEQCQPQIRAMLAQLREGLPAWATWEAMLHHSNLYLAHSRAVYPQYVEELEGIADGAETPFEEIFLAMCEELWEAAAWKRGCTDMAARGHATLDGSTLIAHTNDLLPETEDNLVILKTQAVDEPELLGVSVGGVGISAGFNDAKISLTGNQLDQNDIRPGAYHPQRDFGAQSSSIGNSRQNPADGLRQDRHAYPGQNGCCRCAAIPRSGSFS